MSKKSPNRKIFVTITFLILVIGGWFAWTPVNKQLSKKEIDRMREDYPKWFTAISDYAATMDRPDRTDEAEFHGKETVIANLPPTVRVAVVVDTNVPVISTRYKEPNQYQVALDTSADYWMTLGVFQHEGGSTWGRTLSCWIDGAEGKRHRLVMFMEPGARNEVSIKKDKPAETP